MRAHAAVVALLVLPLAACGGGLSKSELVAKGDAICNRVNAQIAKDLLDLRRVAVGADAQKAQAEYRRLSHKIGFKRCGGEN
jgi:hypothetical protein